MLRDETEHWTTMWQASYLPGISAGVIFSVNNSFLLLNVSYKCNDVNGSSGIQFEKSTWDFFFSEKKTEFDSFNSVKRENYKTCSSFLFVILHNV